MLCNARSRTWATKTRMTGWDLSDSARSFSPQVWQVSILLTSSSQLLNYGGILEVSDWGAFCHGLWLFLQSLNFVVVFQTCAERKMKFWINDRPARRWSVSGNARCGNTAHSSPWHTGTAIKNRPHVPSQGRQPVPVTAPRHPAVIRGRVKTDKSHGQHREVDKMTLTKLQHCCQPGSDWRQQTLRRQENWKMAFTRIRIDNEEDDPSWQQLGAKAARAVTGQRQEGCSELIVFLGHFKVAWRQPSQGWQLAGIV